MDKNEIKKTFEKQLELLSERSKNCDEAYLDKITNGMISIAQFFLDNQL